MRLKKDRTPKEREHESRVANDRDQAVKKMYGEKIDPHKKLYSNFNLYKEDKGKERCSGIGLLRKGRSKMDHYHPHHQKEIYQA